MARYATIYQVHLDVSVRADTRAMRSNPVRGMWLKWLARVITNVQSTRIA